ncbi:MAG TPA: hypothetical protein VFC78_03270 [Tepidisphaeraceae bacterium]|nr:hypothetical protein [Tepidisphaeraceae bacterium]
MKAFRRIFWRTLLAASLLCGAPLRAGPPSPQQIDQAVENLGDTDPGVRERAAALLRGAGSSARAALQAAAAGDDPEIAARAREILRDASAIAAPRPREAQPKPPQVIQYLASAPGARRQLIGSLGNGNDTRALCALWVLETNAGLRAAIFNELLKDPTTAAGHFVADENFATAELLLESAVDGHLPDAPQAYARYWLARGRIDEPLRRWVARGNGQPPDPWAQQVLAALYRAKGDRPQAASHAQASQDPEVLQSTLLATGDWVGLSALLHRNTAAAQTSRDLMLAIGADDFGGDTKLLESDLTKLAALPHDPAEAQFISHALLLIDHPAEAVAAMLSAGNYAAAYQVLITRGKFDEADALLARFDSINTQEAMLLRCAAAREMARLLGQKKECAARCARVAGENAAGKFPAVFVALGEAERAAGETGKSWEYFLASIEAAGQPNWAISQVARAFPSGKNGVDWPAIWRLAQRTNPGRPVAQLFDRVRRAYDREMPLEELVDAVNGVDLSNLMNKPYEALAWEAVRRLHMADQEYKVQVEQWAFAASSGDLYVHLGDWAGEENNWAQAFDYYEKAWQKDRTQALPLYLEGWALKRGGREAEGRDRVDLAHSLPLANDRAGGELLKGLIEHGLDDAAAHEARALARTCQYRSGGGFIALQIGAAQDVDRGDFASAADRLKRAMGGFMINAYSLPEPRMYLYLSHQMHLAQARALLAAGDFDAAQHEADVCQKMLPTLDSLPIALVHDFEKLGRRKEADGLFNKWFTAGEARCARFPNSGHEFNEQAWLAAQCHRQLDKALACADRAVALEPTDVPIIDTLAEVHYQRGEYDAAIAAIKRCIALDPDSIRNRRQLALFEAARSRKADETTETRKHGGASENPSRLPAQAH